MRAPFLQSDPNRSNRFNRRWSDPDSAHDLSGQERLRVEALHRCGPDAVADLIADLAELGDLDAETLRAAISRHLTRPLEPRQRAKD